MGMGRRTPLLRSSVLAERAKVMTARHLAGHRARDVPNRRMAGSGPADRWPQARAGRDTPRLRLLALVVGRFALQDGETSVVVGELGQVRERDLAGHDDIVAADIGFGVPGPMLELDTEPHPELLEVTPQRPEVDPELRRDGARLIFREIPLGGLVNASHCHLLRVRLSVEGGWHTRAARLGSLSPRPHQIPKAWDVRQVSRPERAAS